MTDSTIIKVEEELGRGTQREFPDALLKAICRSILKEKLQRQMKLRAVMELCPKKRTKMPDVEEFHDIEEARMVTELLA